MGSTIDQAMLDSAKVAVETCMGIKPGEQVLIVTDPVCRTSTEAFYQAIMGKEAEPLLLLMEPREMVGAEPPPAVARILRGVDAVYLPVTKSLTHTKVRQEASAAGVRIASLPGLTEDIMVRSVGADYQAIAAVTRRLAMRMRNSKRAHITSSAGTDLTMDITARPLI
jgi:leucyl aminopeptidase (aminopeptidase T)